MIIGWKAYLRSGQVIEFTAEHEGRYACWKRSGKTV
jgi:hypothetical protein